MTGYLRGAAALLLLPAVALGACKEATLGPTERGAISGQVLDYETGQPIAGAAITTSPPSEALVSDSMGNFLVEQLDTGNYQVTARKSGYRPSTVAVSVREDRTASAAIFLEERDETADDPQIVVEVLGFWNEQLNDSTFVEAEYRVRNDGDVAVSDYEVYFRIVTDGTTYYREEQGGALPVGQVDVGRFRTYIPTPPVTAVELDDLWTDPPIGSTP